MIKKCFFAAFAALLCFGKSYSQSFDLGIIVAGSKGMMTSDDFVEHRWPYDGVYKSPVKPYAGVFGTYYLNDKLTITQEIAYGGQAIKWKVNHSNLIAYGTNHYNISQLIFPTYIGYHTSRYTFSAGHQLVSVFRQVSYRKSTPNTSSNITHGKEMIKKMFSEVLLEMAIKIEEKGEFYIRGSRSIGNINKAGTEHRPYYRSTDDTAGRFTIQFGYRFNLLRSRFFKFD